MNEENNNLGMNTNPTEPVTPVETPAPVEMPTPVEAPSPVEPVAAPVEAPAPVETPAPAETPAPVEAPTPTETPVQSDVPTAEPAPVQPGLVNPAPEPDKKDNKLFLIVVVVLIIAILGIGCYIVMNINKGSSSGNSTTTTTTTTKAGFETTTRNVTTVAGTTTNVRTTRGANEPTPVKSDSTTVNVGKYNLPIPTGFEIYTKNTSSYPQLVNMTDKVIFTFQPTAMTFSKFLKSYDTIEAELQSSGFEILDSAAGTYGNRSWGILELGGSQVPSGYTYNMLATDYDSTTTLVIYVLIANSSSTSAEKIVSTLTTMVDSKTNAFDSSEVTISDSIDYKAFDELDERLLG